MRCTRKGRAWLVAMLTLGAGAACLGDEFQWTPYCPSNNWHATCIGEQCSADPPLFWTYNNWGGVGCASPAFPGPTDLAVIPISGPLLTGSAAVAGLTLGPVGTLDVYGCSAQLAAGAILNEGAMRVADGAEILIAGDVLIQNEGTITLHYGGMCGEGVLRCDGNATLDGTGSLVFSDAALVEGAGTLTNHSGHTIRGNSGEIRSPLHNEGVVRSDAAGRSISLTSTEKVNAGTFEARGGAFLDISTPVDQSGGGTLWAGGAGSRVRLWSGASVLGGMFETADAGEIYTSGGSTTVTLTDLTNLGTCRIADGATVVSNGMSLYNYGTIGLYYGGMYGSAHLRFDSDVDVTGWGTIYLEDGDIDTAGGATFTHSPHHIIDGRFGTIGAAMSNLGTITARFAPYAVTLADKPKSNAGTMQALDGAKLDIETTITQFVPGTIRAEGAGSQVRLRNGAAIVGGTLATASNGELFSSGGSTIATLTDVTNLGTYRVVDGATLAVNGTLLTNEGVIGLYYGGMAGGAHLRFDTDVTVEGAGQIHLDDGDISTADGVTFTNASGHTLDGRFGQVSAALDNYGTLTARVAPYAVALTSRPKWNAGLMQAVSGAKLDVQAAITQSAAGVLRADGADSQVRLANGASILGGRLETASGGLIYGAGGGRTFTLGDLTNAGEIRCADGATLAIAGSTLVNNGHIGLYYGGMSGGAHLRFDSSVLLDGTGEVFLETGDLTTAPGTTLTVGAGQTLYGVSQQTLNAALTNYGRLEASSTGWSRRLCLGCQSPGVVNRGMLEIWPDCHAEVLNGSLFTQEDGQIAVNGELHISGGPLAMLGGTLTGTGLVHGAVNNSGGTVAPGTSTGQLRIDGAYQQGAGGALRIEFGGTDPGRFDVLSVTGAATLGGALRLVAVNSFYPQPGQQFTVLTAASLSGDFESITGMEGCSVAKIGNSVVVTIETVVDPGLDGDCDVDLADLSLLLVDFGCNSGDCAGDLDGDGFTNLVDLVILLTSFGTACP